VFELLTVTVYREHDCIYTPSSRPPHIVRNLLVNVGTRSPLLVIEEKGSWDICIRPNTRGAARRWKWKLLGFPPLCLIDKAWTWEDLGGNAIGRDTCITGTEIMRRFCLERINQP
jgi:hypothetical protein